MRGGNNSLMVVSFAKTVVIANTSTALNSTMATMMAKTMVEVSPPQKWLTSGSHHILQRSMQGNTLADLTQFSIKEVRVCKYDNITPSAQTLVGYQQSAVQSIMEAVAGRRVALLQLGNGVAGYNFINKMNRQRPYRPETRGPFRDIEDPYYPSNPARSDLTMLEEENTILKLKCGKVSELQEKVDMVLKQNAQLLSENEKMSRILHQYKSENDLLKNKIDSLSVQGMGSVNSYEIEKKKLLIELERVGDDMAELELQKNNQISQIKSAYQIQLQSLRRQVHNTEHSSQTEIRKYRDQIEKREQELNEYVGKLKRLTTDTDYEILRLKEDKEKLRAEIEYGESDHVKEIESLKNRLENNYLDELEALKRAHIKALDETEKENIRLKGLLQERGRQIDQISNKYSKQRTSLEDNLDYLKKDNESLRKKIVQTEDYAHYELDNLKEHLNSLHESEVEELVAKQHNQIRILQDEIGRLENGLHEKNMEIEQLIKDKVSNRNIFDSELARVKDDYGVMIQKCKEQEVRLLEVSSQATVRITDKEKNIQYLEDVLKDQKSSFESEQTALHKAIEALRQDLHSERINTREKDQNHKEEISHARHQNQELKLSSEQREGELQKFVNELKNELNGTSSMLGNRVDNLAAQNKALEKENEALKNSLIIKEKEIKALSERLRSSGDREARLEGEIDDLRNKLIKREQKSNQSINDQKTRLQATYAYALDSLKTDYEASLRLEGNKQKDLQQKLRKKELELEQLLRMYKKMMEEIQVLTEQQANKKDITLKFPGATADLIASKNLFDVYLKTKVLDVCGDALKENSRRA